MRGRWCWITQTNRVLGFLRKNAYREYNVKTIARHLKLSENTVKVSLHRLHNKGLILRSTKGFYKAYADITVLREQQLKNPPTLLHGILLECTIAKQVTKWGQGTTPQPLKKWLHAHDFAYRSDNKTWFRYVWWTGRRITITVTSSNNVYIYFSSTKNPLNYPDFELLLSFLDGYFEGVAPFRDRRVVKLKEVGLAKDFKELRLEGVKSVSLRAFKNAFARLYYKDDDNLTRFEHHLVLDMSLDEALKSLSILTTPVNYEKQLSNIIDERLDVT